MTRRGLAAAVDKLLLLRGIASTDIVILLMLAAFTAIAVYLAAPGVIYGWP